MKEWQKNCIILYGIVFVSCSLYFLYFPLLFFFIIFRFCFVLKYQVYVRLVSGLLNAVQSSAKRKKEKNEIGNPARCVAAAANIYIYDYVFERAFRSFRFRTLLPRGVRKKKNVARHETSVLNVETTISTESQFENTIKFYRCHTHKSNRL